MRLLAAVCIVLLVCAAFGGLILVMVTWPFLAAIITLGGMVLFLFAGAVAVVYARIS